MEAGENEAQRAGNENQNSKAESFEEVKSKEERIGIRDEDHNIVGGTSGNSPTNEQPSGSQNNKWQQDQDHEGENASQPARQLRTSDDDEFEEETRKAKRQDDLQDEDDLESTDMDFRDGENRSGEDQDDDDALRNGM